MKKEDKRMKNDLKDLSEELLKDISRLEGFSSHLIEEELVHNLATKLDSLTAEDREERIKAMRNMFALGQIFPTKHINKEDEK